MNKQALKFNIQQLYVSYQRRASEAFNNDQQTIYLVNLAKAEACKEILNMLSVDDER